METDRQGGRQADRWTDKHGDRQAGQADRWTDKHGDRETDRQGGRQAGWQTGR